MKIDNLFAELKRRNVIRFAGLVSGRRVAATRAGVMVSRCGGRWGCAGLFLNSSDVQRAVCGRGYWCGRRTVLPMFGAPDWLPRSIVILLAIGFLPALIFSWVFELTPHGLKRDEDVRPEESIAPQTARRMNRMIIAVLVLALGYFAVDKFVLAPRRG